MTIYQGQAPAVRTQYVLAFVSAFGCMLALGILHGGAAGRYTVFARGGLITASILVIWIGVGRNFQMQYTDDVRYQEDKYIASCIMNDLQKTDEAAELPVIFVGHRPARLNGACRGMDMYGESFFNWDYEVNPERATERIVGFMNTQGLDITGAAGVATEAIEYSRRMSSYPHEGYISVQNGYVIVKLSEDVN